MNHPFNDGPPGPPPDHGGFNHQPPMHGGMNNHIPQHNNQEQPPLIFQSTYNYGPRRYRRPKHRHRFLKAIIIFLIIVTIIGAIL